MTNKVTKMEQMRKEEFRKFCGKALKKMGFHKVRVLDEERRQCGIDFIATRGGVSYGIRSAVGQKEVGNAAVQDAFQGSRYFELDVPVVLGNNVFSADAVKLAEKRKAELWDGRELLADAFEKYVGKLDRKIAREKAWEAEVDRELQQMIDEANAEPVPGTGRTAGAGLSDASGRLAGIASGGYVLNEDWDKDCEKDWNDVSDDPDSQGYIPDDFEPDLDPYDRQALYDEEVIDDLVLSQGGNPFDFEDRMDALSDPFGLGGDGDSWD